MSNGNNKRNRATRREILQAVSDTLRLFYRGKREEADMRLKQVSTAFASVPDRRGRGWDEANKLYSDACSILCDHCECWYCSLIPQQEQEVGVGVRRRVAALVDAYPDKENKYIDALAEVIFRVRFGLTDNQFSGFEGGVTLAVPCSTAASGKLTIGIKGTEHGKYSGGGVRSSLPYQPNWNQSRDHIYVCIQVIDRKHVFFCGFAFGDDKKSAQISFVGNARQRWKAPSTLRTLEELECLMANRPPPPIALPRSHAHPAKENTVREKPVDPCRLDVRPKATPSNGTLDASQQVPVPTFLRHELVQHPHYGVGKVLEDAIPRFLGLQSRWDEDVTVQFDESIKKVTATLAGLTHIREQLPSDMVNSWEQS
jgi:hypothetical protein